jgi:dolichol-phosphate mannosyltransferase
LALDPSSNTEPQISPTQGGGYELTVVIPSFNERGNVKPLLERLDVALAGVAWQAIYVDDNSPDGTAEAVKAEALSRPNVACIRRIGRRGLAGAVIEGALASAAPYVAVMDADLQHDETLLPRMLASLHGDEADLAIASRYVGEGDATQGFSKARGLASAFATWLAKLVLRAHVTDPVSGFFMVRRQVIDEAAPRLSSEGFKILFDLIASAGGRLRIKELPYVFRERTAGESKLDNRVALEYIGLLVSKATHNLVSPRFILFGLVGASGLVVNLVAFKLISSALASSSMGGSQGFVVAQFLAAVIAMTSNYLINNVVTYRDRRKTGLALITGYLRFCLLCAVGLMANVAVGNLINETFGTPLLASTAGAAFGAVWNYMTTRAAVW